MRTPARGQTPADPLLSTSPSQNDQVTTRSTTAKNRYRYVDGHDRTPNDTNWENYIVILGASVTKLEGPVYGIIGEPVTIAPKGKKKKSQRGGFYVRELFENTIGSEAYKVERDNLEFITKIRHDSQLEGLLFRPARYLNIVGELEYCQVVEVHLNDEGLPEGLTVMNRGDEPSQGDDHILNPDQLKICSMNEYMLDYGAGLGKKKELRVNRTGVEFVENIESMTDILTLRGKSSVFLQVTCDMGEEITYLTEVGEWKQTTPEEYFETEVYEAEDPEEEPAPIPTGKLKAVKVKKEKKAKIKVAVPKKSKVTKTLFPEKDRDSESEDEDEDEDEDVLTGIDNFVITPRVKKSASTSSKFDIQVNELRRERHEAIMNQDLLDGKFRGMTIEARADRLYRMESKRGQYLNSKTLFQIWFFGNIGEDPIAYFAPFERVPTSEVQGIPNEKWTTSTPPDKWVKTMKELSECLAVLADICHQYYRYDVYTAVEAIARKAYRMSDMNLAMAGVNAYRDLYCNALAAVVDGAVEGLTGEKLLETALGEVHPSSKSYSDIIVDRLQRVSAGAQWGKTTTPGTGNGGRGDGSRGGRGDGARGDGGRGDGGKGEGGKGDKSKKAMTEAQKDLIPVINGRKVCLAFMSTRDCKRPECIFLHDASPEVPEGLRNFFRKRFGPAKSAPQQ